MRPREARSASGPSQPDRVPASPVTVAESVAFFAAYGLTSTPVRHGDTTGRLRGWSQPGHGVNPSVFGRADDVGVLNGTEPTAGWFFHDVALLATSHAARRIARRLLPDTGWRYGCPSQPESHANYLVPKPLRTRQYVGSDGRGLIELRGLTRSRMHTLSVAPGSSHVSGEPIRFCEPRGEIGRVADPDELDRAVQRTAVAVVVARVWPAAPQHRLRVALARVLLEHDVSPEHTMAILAVVMEVTGSDVADVQPAVRRTEAALRLGHPTEGASTIREVLGQDVGQRALVAIARMLQSGAVDATTGVVMDGGRLVQIVDCAELALVRGGAPIYQRGGSLIRPVKLPHVGHASADDEIQRDPEATVLLAVREPWLMEQMSQTLTWFQRRGDALVRADPKALYARTLLHRAEWRFPVLGAVLTAPTLSRDSRIIEQPGFDAASGLLLDVNAGTFPPVPVAPTRDDAEAALGTLLRPLRGFPFVNAARDRSPCRLSSRRWYGAACDRPRCMALMPPLRVRASRSWRNWSVCWRRAFGRRP